MKLSYKGINVLVVSCCDPDQVGNKCTINIDRLAEHEFQPDDFEDTVGLTKEQAKIAQTAVAVILNDSFDEQSPQHIDLRERLGSLLDTLIEQLKVKEP